MQLQKTPSGTETIPGTSAPSTEVSGEDGNEIVWVIVIIAVAAVIGGVVAFVVIKKKK
jgi:hypothetical protein